MLLLTGAFEPFDQERAARVGCDGFLAKPFEPQTLIAKVKDLLSQAGAKPARGPGARAARRAARAAAAPRPRPLRAVVRRRPSSGAVAPPRPERARVLRGPGARPPRRLRPTPSPSRTPSYGRRLEPASRRRPRRAARSTTTPTFEPSRRRYARRASVGSAYAAPTSSADEPATTTRRRARRPEPLATHELDGDACGR